MVYYKFDNNDKIYPLDWDSLDYAEEWAKQCRLTYQRFSNRIVVIGVASSPHPATFVTSRDYFDLPITKVIESVDPIEAG